jgi:hypothetical protein
MNQNILQPSSWPHITKFIDALNQQFFKLTSPCTFYGANVVQMQTLDVVEIFDNKLATLKVDGERHILFLFVEKNLEVRGFVMCRNGTINDVVIPNFCILRPGTQLKPGYFSIFDAEFYNGRWIVFDCLVYRASKMVCTNMDFTERLVRLQKSFTEDFESMYIHVKPYYPVNSDLRNLYESTIGALGFDVQHDGIIFQPMKGIYPIGSNMNLVSGRGLKWKDQCTIDLVPERMKLFDIKRLHSQLYGEHTITKTFWNTLIHSNDYYGTHEYCSNVTSTTLHGTFEIPKTLCKLRCVSDFSYGTNPILIPVTCRLESTKVDVPLCVHLDPSDHHGVQEYLIDHTFQPELLRIRNDKLVSQANKARTVAGVLWQAKNYQNIFDLIDDPARIPKRIQHVLPEIVSNSNNQILFNDFIRGYVSFESHNKTYIENEFKIIQTKRPKNGNGLFQSLQEPNYETSSCLDGLHYQRAMDGIIKKYKKADPSEVRTIDFIVDSTLRLTAYEDVIQTRSNKPLVLYKTNGFHGTRKVASGQSYFVQLPEIEKKSGYVYRLDTRTESPEFFCRHEFLTANEDHLNFLKSYETMINSTKRKRANEAIPNNYKGYRFVDSYEFKPEIERNVPLERIRRSVFDAIQLGEVVEVNYYGHGTYHTGKICKIHNGSNVVDVEYAYNVRAMNFHYKSGYIPIVIDAVKGCMLRIKRRKTFEFEGFKIDFTRTKNIIDFKPTEKRRLHHLMNRCDSYEVEIELNQQIKNQPSYIEKLREVMMSLYEFMGLDENSFLFDHVTIPSLPENLSNVLTDYSRYIGYTDELHDLHPVFIKTIQGVSRVVHESDFHAMFDEEMDILLPPIEKNEFTPEEMSIELPLERVSEYVEVNDVIVNDYIARRIFKTLEMSSNGEYVLHQLGTEIFANNICWTKPDETFKLLCNQLGVVSLHEIEDEDFLQQLRSILFGVTSGEIELNTFFYAPFEFGKVLYEYYCKTMKHAWYDESEVSYVWNDILYFAKRFGNMLYYSLNSADLTELFGTSLLSYHVHRDTAKLSVIVGFIQQCRLHSQTNDIMDNMNLMSLTLEYSKYTPRHQMNQMDVTPLKNITPVLLL